MKSFLLSVFSFAMAFSISAMPMTATAQLVPCMGGFFCFGGQVLSIITCDEGIQVYLGPPSAGLYMWPYGLLTYQNFIPPIPNQWNLGWAQGFLTCTVGIITIGGGFIYIGHGSSLV